MSDTRVLLNRVAEFRKRLDAMPRLIPAPPSAEGRTNSTAEVDSPRKAPEGGSRTQAILEYSLRQLAGTPDVNPPALSSRARRLLVQARGLVTRMKTLADEPLLAGPPPGSSSEVADPLVVHFRETAALTEAAVRYALAFPESTAEQERLCEGLEAMIDATARRLELLAGAIERKRFEESRMDVLARFLVSLDQAAGPVDPGPVFRLADALLAEEPGRPLRLLAADPVQTQAYLGGPEYPPTVRFVAAHSLNCACILARIAHADPEWRENGREVVTAGLLHDVGMLRVEAALLARPRQLEDAERQSINAHARAGGERIFSRLPGCSAIAEVAACHHERVNGSGYPGKLTGDRLSPLTRLVAAVDVYAAMCATRPHRPAIDPRAALTDVQLMAERGELDRSAAAKLLGLGLYPSGTVVELRDGTTAVVLTPRDPRGAYTPASRPTVAVLTGPDGKPLANPRYFDLADASNKNVVRALSAADRLNRLARSFPEWA
jgi:hypothetical protein